MSCVGVLAGDKLVKCPARKVITALCVQERTNVKNTHTCRFFKPVAVFVLNRYHGSNSLTPLERQSRFGDKVLQI